MCKNKVVIFFSLICLSSYCYSQKIDSSWTKFIHSDLFKNRLVPFFEKNGEQIYVFRAKDTLISDFCFKNILTNDSYIIRETGIWKVGVNSTEAAYYLLFKKKDKYYFERENIDNILKRFRDFSLILKLSEKEKVLLLHNIFIFVNEVNEYPINIK